MVCKKTEILCYSVAANSLVLKLNFSVDLGGGGGGDLFFIFDFFIVDL